MNKHILRGLSAAGFLTFVASAHAELPAAVGTAVTAAQTDGGTLIGMLAAAGAAVFIIAKILRRFGVFL